MYLNVIVFGFVNVLMERCLWLQQDLLPSLTLPVCVVLLQPSTAFCRAQLRPAANSSDYLAEPLNAHRRPLFLDQKREVGKIKIASWEGFVPTYLLLPRSLIKKNKNRC